MRVSQNDGPLQEKTEDCVSEMLSGLIYDLFEHEPTHGMRHKHYGSLEKSRQPWSRSIVGLRGSHSAQV